MKEVVADSYSLFFRAYRGSELRDRGNEEI